MGGMAGAGGGLSGMGGVPAGAGTAGTGGTSAQNPQRTICRTSQPFARPTVVPGLNGAYGTSYTRFTPDELVAFATVYDSTGDADVVIASRATRSDAFGRAQPIASLDTMGALEGAPTVTDDELTLYMHSDRSGAYGIYVSTRPRPDVEFSSPVAVQELNINGEGFPYVTGDGSGLYFHSGVDGTADLWRATRATAGFNKPEKVNVSTGSYDEWTPVVSADDLTLYWSRSGSTQDGIWMATRASKQDPFGNARLLSELNGMFAGIAPSWISPDNCRLYITVWTGQVYEMHVAERSP